MPQSSPQANTANSTTNTTTNTTTVRDIGLTGAAGSQALADILATANNTIQGGYSFGGDVMNRIANLEQSTTDTLGNSINNALNLARDTSQRAIAAGINQAVPPTIIPAASDSGSGGMSTGTLILIGIGVVGLILLMR